MSICVKRPESALTTDEVRQSRISKLRDKRNQLSDDQWEYVLRSTLLQRRLQGSEARTLEKLEVFASLVGDQLSIIFRNNISGITQKLGEVAFKKDESQELDITGWAGTAVERSNALDREVQDLSSRYDEQTRELDKLNSQLEDLIKAKREHEDSLLKSFSQLLNTKKLKIRDQQRLLAGAKVDPTRAANVQNARSTSKPHAATASRTGKRKAKSGHRDSESSEESGFEGFALKQKSESDPSEQMNTPEHSDLESTEDESGDISDSAPHTAKTPDRNKAAGGEKGARVDQMQLDTLPPTRDLPFGDDSSMEQAKGPARDDKSTLPQEAGNDEETDDDEL